MSSVGLISCVSRKRPKATEAKHLYDSPLFARARGYVEKECDEWYILSAKHGLVLPSQVISPYEETLNKKSRAERERWSEGVWSALCPRLRPGDRVLLLAGLNYREYLIPKLVQHGCIIDVPMKNLGIGRQIQWLAKESAKPSRVRDLDRVYRSLETLSSGVGGKRLVSACTGLQGWPKNGLYFFFEPNEHRANNTEQRVVRVGTHGVSRGSKATLWNRLRTHRGTGGGLGNHRSSIFRLHVGAAIATREGLLAVSSWGAGQTADANTRKGEERLEQAVSQYIGSMSILWLAIEDEASPASDRAYLERNLIGLLAGTGSPIDPPSTGWLGLYSPEERIRRSGLWNLGFLSYQYQREFLDILDQYVLITLGRLPRPSRSLAPPGWYERQRVGSKIDQLILFGESDAHTEQDPPITP